MVRYTFTERKGRIYPRSVYFYRRFIYTSFDGDILCSALSKRRLPERLERLG